MKNQTDKQHQDIEELVTWRKKIEMIGIDIKSLDRKSVSELCLKLGETT
jgi:hypothetical protein